MGIETDNSKVITDIDNCNFILKEALKSKIVGIDLETNSMHVYTESISIIQICVNDNTYIIDVLEIGLPDPIRKIFENESIEKVFQDLQYDLVMLKKEFNCEVLNKFDISLADKLIQETNQSSNMQKLMKFYLSKEVKFSKKQQKSNWLIRPLSRMQIDYAIKDVKYLIKIRNIQCEILEGDHRLELMRYFMDNMQVVVKERYYNNNYVYRIKKQYNITNKDELSRINSLLLTLDELAEKMNKPPHWLFPDHNIVNIARQNPQTFGQFKKLFHIRDRLQNTRKSIERAMFDALQNYEDISFEKRENKSTKRWSYIEDDMHKTDKYHPDIVLKIKEWRSKVAKNLKIIPGMVLDKKMISYLSTNIDKLDDEMKLPGIPSEFQKIVINDLMQYILLGNTTLTIDKLYKK